MQFASASCECECISSLVIPIRFIFTVPYINLHIKWKGCIININVIISWLGLQGAARMFHMIKLTVASSRSHLDLMLKSNGTVDITPEGCNTIVEQRSHQEV